MASFVTILHQPDEALAVATGMRNIYVVLGSVIPIVLDRHWSPVQTLCVGGNIAPLA